MKHTMILFSAALLIASCQKEKSVSPAAGATAATTNTNMQSLAKNGGSGGGGGNNNTSTGLIQNVLSGSASRMVGTVPDSFFVSFSGVVPAGGITLNISSSIPEIQVPATVNVPAGAFNVSPAVTSSNVATAKTATVTVNYGSQTKSTTLRVFPLHYTFSAPSLQSPGNGANFKNRIQVTFQVATNANAYYTEIQISDEPTFSNPMLDFYTENGIVPASYFNGTGTRYWRARYIDGSDNGGPWSQVRNFEIKP